MAGFENDVMVAKNVNYDLAAAKPHLGILNAAGKLAIGTGDVQPLPEALGGNIVSTTLTVGYSSPNITIETMGGGQAVEQVTVDNSTAPGTNPVLPTVGGNLTITGGQVAASSLANVIQTHSMAANEFAVTIQRSSAVGATDSSQNGVSHFNSAQFTVDANGFVSTSGTGIPNTITGDSGGALSPTAGNWNILGRSGSKTSGSGSTLTVNSPPYADQGGSTSVTLNSGSFATAAITLTTPVTAGLANGDLLEFVATNGVLVIQLAATQVAHLGSLTTSAAGTITSTLTGDSVSLRYQASTNDWWATSIVGTWLIA